LVFVVIDSDGISKSDKEEITKALLSKEQGSKVVGASNSENQAISGKSRNSILLFLNSSEWLKYLKKMTSNFV
jgi:hypothetical protein